MIRTANLVLAVVLVVTCHKCGRADFILGEPVNLGSPVNTAGSDGTPCISADGLSLYFTSDRPGGSGLHDLRVATRTSEKELWSSPVNLGSRVNSSSLDYFPCISADGLSLYFYSTRSGGRGGGDIWGTTRSSLDAPWTQAVNLGPQINSGSEDVSPNLSPDGLSLLFASNRPGGRGDYDLYISTRESNTSLWSAPVNLGAAVNTAALEVAPSLSSDGLTLVFHSIRSGGYGSYDLHLTRRASVDQAWSSPVNLGPVVNSTYSELGPSLSADGRFLYFSDHYANPPRPGGLGTDDIWQVSITPIVDFNGDGVVDCADICMMLEYWHTNEPLYDTAPPPFGDGLVDTQDLNVLGEYLFTCPGAIAYWKLDETEGDIACDSVGVYDGILNGGPAWQPTGGCIGGALELDGADDCVSTPFVVDPGTGVFSVFAWVKGGMPGQVILSQEQGADWLLADASGGTLATDLKGGRLAYGPPRAVVTSVPPARRRPARFSPA